MSFSIVGVVFYAFICECWCGCYCVVVVVCRFIGMFHPTLVLILRTLVWLLGGEDCIQHIIRRRSIVQIQFN